MKYGSTPPEIIMLTEPSADPLQVTFVVITEASSNSGSIIMNSSEIEEHPSLSITVIE